MKHATVFCNLLLTVFINPMIMYKYGIKTLYKHQQ
jgi:hypothetical protein